MNHDFYFSMLTKQKEKELFYELNRFDFCYGHNLYGVDTGWKVAGQTRTGRAAKLLKAIGTLIGGRIYSGSYGLLKGIENAKYKSGF